MTQLESDNDNTQSVPIVNQGTIVSQYRIVERIGAGGMGEVYLAEDTRLDRNVALKFMPVHLVGDEGLRQRFTREAQAAAKLDHPNIITIYEVGEFSGRPFIAMRYVDGKTVQHYCRDEQLPLEKIVEIVTQIADGLAMAHGHGIIHRDIKSVNIILDKELRPRILDFGLAAVQGSDMLTKTGTTLGTVAYMSPEQARGMDTDQRSDLFSLGVVLYELIAGKPPYRRDNDAATLQAIITDNAEPLARFKSDVPDELQRIVSKCLAKDPAHRYQSAADLAADLRSLQHERVSSSSQVAIGAQEEQPSIAVLPFTNMSADPENEFFSDGLTEEVLNVLVRIPELKVTGRTSSFAFKGKHEDLREIGQKLGVNTLLEGSVRKAGNRVRITAQLVKSSDGFHLWSEAYDRVLDDIFAVQDDIAKSVADALHVTLLGGQTKAHAVDAESYTLVLRGRELARQNTKSTVLLAMKLFREAIELDEKNAAAFAGLADGYIICASYGHLDGHKELLRNAKENLDKALALDDTLPQIYLALGWLRAAFEFRFEEATAAFEKLRELAPNSSQSLWSLSIIKQLFERYDEAIQLGRDAVDLDPLDPEARTFLAKALFCAGELDDARSEFKRVLELAPGTASANLSLSWVYLLQGELENALNYAKREENAGYRNCGLAMVYHAMGNKVESDRATNELLKEEEHWSFQIAAVYAYRREVDEAFKWLEHSYATSDAGTPLTRVHPLLRNLHSDPRWPILIEKIGLADDRFREQFKTR